MVGLAIEYITGDGLRTQLLLKVENFLKEVFDGTVSFKCCKM